MTLAIVKRPGPKNQLAVVVWSELSLLHCVCSVLAHCLFTPWQDKLLLDLAGKIALSFLFLLFTQCCYRIIVILLFLEQFWQVFTFFELIWICFYLVRLHLIFLVLSASFAFLWCSRSLLWFFVSSSVTVFGALSSGWITRRVFNNISQFSLLLDILSNLEYLLGKWLLAVHSFPFINRCVTDYQ